MQNETYLIPHAPGIYFGMSDDEYHADPSLSSSRMKILEVSPKQYYSEVIDPDSPDREETAAMQFGKALHTLFLQPDKFSSEYVQDIILPMDALDTVKDLQTWCAHHQVEFKKSASKPEMIATVLAADPNAPVVETLRAEFNRKNEGKLIIGNDDWLTLTEMFAEYNADPEAGFLFEGGYPEVSIFWLEDGVPMKMRVDKLKSGYSVDLKTFQNSRRKNIERATEYLLSEEYLLQAYVYTRGVAAVCDMIEAGNALIYVNGQPAAAFSDEVGFVNKILATEDRSFIFAFIENSRPFNITHKIVDPSSEDGGFMFWAKAELKYMELIGIFRDCVQKFGFSKKWNSRPPATKVTDVHVPAYVFSDVITESKEITV